MNIYKSLNEITQYIESNLENKIEYDTLAKMLGVNEYTLQRIFTLICNISISEYIRKRRLSNAGFDLYHSDDKIIDIAIKYQYDSATSFSRAFEKFHGIKPSSVKLNPEKLAIFTKIVFNEETPEKKDIEYKIIEHEEFTLYGKGVKPDEITIKKDAPKFWQEFLKEYHDKYCSPNYGMIVYEKRFESDKLEYWVLYDKEIFGFEKHFFPKCKWISLIIPSEVPKEIQEVSEMFYREFLPSSKYNLKEIPELEYYHDGITEFLIPIDN